MRATRQVNKSTHAARGAERTTGSEEKTNAEAENSMMQHLQQLYVQIDEPDGIEGISAHMPVLDIQQIILDHKKAGRWTAAQGWYEIELAKPQYDNALQLDLQVQLLTCLKESGQHGLYSESSKCNTNNGQMCCSIMWKECANYHMHKIKYQD